ncbi:MAG: DUF6933 domain-containing protein [Burkholderiales bacterium]
MADGLGDGGGIRRRRTLTPALSHGERECFFGARDIGRSGIASAVIARVDEVLGAPRFDTKTDRSVLASMNIALGDLAAHVARVAHILELDPLRASQQLNRRPARAPGKWLRPERALRELLMRHATV